MAFSRGCFHFSKMLPLPWWSPQTPLRSPTSTTRRRRRWLLQRRPRTASRVASSAGPAWPRSGPWSSSTRSQRWRRTGTGPRLQWLEQVGERTIMFFWSYLIFHKGLMFLETKSFPCTCLCRQLYSLFWKTTESVACEDSGLNWLIKWVHWNIWD